MKINFVCYGNICRSPMAEFVMKNLKAAEEKHRQAQALRNEINIFFDRMSD